MFSSWVALQDLLLFPHHLGGQSDTCPLWLLHLLQDHLLPLPPSKRLCVASTLSALPVGLVLANSSFSFIFTFLLLPLDFFLQFFLLCFYLSQPTHPREKTNQECHEDSHHHPSWSSSPPTPRNMTIKHDQLMYPAKSV